METSTPHTPSRGRSAYPAHLTRAGEGPRVPLHRRGTSQTLECFDDLLREAGYKETRVFTPESERAEAAAETRRKQAERKRDTKGRGGVKSGATGLVGFLTGLVPWSDSENDGPTRRRTKTQSLGRSAGKQQSILLNDDDDEVTQPLEDSSDVHATPTPNRRKPFTPIILTSDLSSPGSSSSTSSRSPPQPHVGHHSRSSNTIITNKQLQRTRNDARATLRHMISSPEFAVPQRPAHPNHALSRRVTTNATSHSNAPRRQSTHSRIDNSKTQLDSEALPPLPQNWLNTVTQAVIGASGAHIGRPLNPSRAQGQGHGHSRSMNVNPAHDQQNTNEYTRRDGSLARRGFAPRTPLSDTTPGIVTAASVVCRSAPGLRSSSLVRTRSNGGRSRGRPQARDREACLPSLGVTSVEVVSARKASEDGHDAYSYSDAAPASTDDSEANNDDGDSSDGAELDFARLIVPARRQRSIHSLRRHLHNHAAAAANSRGSKVPPSAYTRAPSRPESRLSVHAQTRPLLNDVSEPSSDVQNDPDGLNSMLRSRRGSIDEDSEAGMLADWAAHGLPGLEGAVNKKRGALPWTGRPQGR